jgi:hypothetical protein
VLGYSWGTTFLNAKINFKPEPNFKLQYPILTSIFLRIDHTLPHCIAYGESNGVFLIRLEAKNVCQFFMGYKSKFDFVPHD